MGNRGRGGIADGPGQIGAETREIDLIAAAGGGMMTRLRRGEGGAEIWAAGGGALNSRQGTPAWFQGRRQIFRRKRQTAQIELGRVASSYSAVTDEHEPKSLRAGKNFSARTFNNWVRSSVEAAASWPMTRTRKAPLTAACFHNSAQAVENLPAAYSGLRLTRADGQD